jgi:hypothetical protein
MAGFLELQLFHGFDPAPPLSSLPGDPAWQMVPLGGARGVMLNEGQDLQLRATTQNGHPPIFHEVTPPASRQRVIWISGQGTRSDATLEAIDPKDSSTKAKLEIGVLESRELRLAFHIVSDAAGHSTTKVTCTQTPAWLNTVNDIHGLQANIRFTSVRCSPLPMSGDLGDEVNPAAATSQLLELARTSTSKLPMSDADLFVFFVWKIRDTDPNKPTVGNTPAPLKRFIFIEETEIPQDVTLAHEIGHALGLEHPDAQSDRLNLMFPDSPGRLLNKPEILKANANAKDLFPR